MRVNIKSWQWFILIAPFLKPAGIVRISAPLGYLFDIGIIFSYIILAILVIISKDKTGIKEFILTAGMFGLIILVTIVNGGNIGAIIRVFLSCTGLMLAAIYMKKNPQVANDALMIVLEILIYLNFLTQIIYPHGMYITSDSGNWNNWLLGYDNHWFILYFVAYYVALMNAKYSNGYIRSLVLITCIHVSSFITMSGVIVAGLLIMDIVLALKIYRMSFFNFKTLIVLSIILSIIFIVFVNLSIVQNFISSLSKTNSIIGRTQIWQRTMLHIYEHPFFGNGRVDSSERQIQNGLRSGINAHNMWLEILYEGGFFALLLFIVVLILVVKKMSEKNDGVDTELVLIPLSACMITMTMDSILESRGALFFYLIVVAYNISYYKVETEKRNWKMKIKL